MSRVYEHLLSPLRVGPFTLRNRVLVTGHIPGLEAGGKITDEYIAYQRARAAGGAALQITGSTHVHSTGAVGAGRGIDGSTDEVVEGYARLADAIHEEGGRFLVQLGHAGATVDDTDVGRPLLAPSPVMSRIVRETPKEMTADDIDELVDAHRSAAERVRESGLDGVEILGAFGYLVGAFMSPFSNERTDDHGGSLDNRLRFARRVIAALRHALGPDLVLGLRIPGDEWVAGGLGVEDLQEIAERLTAPGELDYLNVIAGTNYDRFGRMDHWPPTPAPHGLFVPLAAGIRARVDVPVFTTGRVTDAALADRIVAAGDADMVGMTRAHISDPDVVAKLTTERAPEIRPCVGANVCIARAFEGRPVRCFHNPEAGREHEWGRADATETPRRVIVIGGGPAGLEAARVAAQRGHRVTLFEAADELGGRLRLWALAPMTGEFGRTIEWYERELERLGVAVHRGRPVGSDDVAAADADAVVLATGAVPLTSGIPDDGSIGTVDPVTMLTHPVTDRRVLVNDEGGGRTALSVADRLLDDNEIVITTSEYAVAELVTPTVRRPLYRRLVVGGAELMPNTEIVHIVDGAVRVRNVHSGAETDLTDIDVVVDWRGARVEDSLHRSIRRTGLPVYPVGDCVAPRQVHIAIAEGALAGRSV